MLRIPGLILAFLIFVPKLQAADCVETKDCKSELIRAEIAPSVLSTDSNQWILPALEKFAESPMLESLLARGYKLNPVGIPHDKERCFRERLRRNPLYNGITCENPKLCLDPNLNPDIRVDLCFKLPCPIFEGSVNAGKCDSVQDIFLNKVGFPDPLEIKKIKLKPTKVELKGDKAQLCFVINELEIDMSTSISWDNSGTRLPENEVKIANIKPKLDRPRNVCITSDINLQGPLVSNMKIQVEGGPLISDDVIRQAAQGIRIEGISGYTQDDVTAIQAEVAPVLFQPVRDTVDKAMNEGLAEVFQEEILALIKPQSNQSMRVETSNFVNEISLPNMQYKNAMAKNECVLLIQAGQKIPENHPCIGLDFWGVPLNEKTDCKVLKCESGLNFNIPFDTSVTSESAKQMLIRMIPLIEKRPLSEFFSRGKPPEEIERLRKFFNSSDIANIRASIDKISKAQLADQVRVFMDIQSQLRENSSSNVGLIVPELCTETPSPHANREIKNCPVQVYTDLNEFNRMFEHMWETGKMCERGKGKFVPKLDAQNKPIYNEKGKPSVVSGCFLNIGDMGCYVDKPPKIKYVPRTKKYNIDMPLKACHFPGIFFGMFGGFGADFNLDLSVKPMACYKGDLCLNNPDIKMKVIPGSERGAIVEGGSLSSTIRAKIDEEARGYFKEGIRLPISEQLSPLANIQVESDGRIDAGPGYFGACFNIKKGTGQ